MPTIARQSRQATVAARMRGDSAQSPKVRIPGAPVHVWLAAAGMLGACLVVLAALVGARPSAGHPVDVIPGVGNAIEATLRRPVVAAFLAALLVVFFVGAIRCARLRWLASRPGPVDVADLNFASVLAEGMAAQLRCGSDGVWRTCTSRRQARSPGSRPARTSSSSSAAPPVTPRTPSRQSPGSSASRGLARPTRSRRRWWSTPTAGAASASRWS